MRIRATHLVVPLYVVAAILYTWPVGRDFTTSIPAGGVFVDAPLQAFLLGWDGHALSHDPRHVFDPPIFYPERNTLTYMDHLIGETVLASPLLAWSPSVAPGYNFLLLFSFVVSAWAVYRLARLFAVSRPAAFLAGFLYAFSSFRFTNLDELNQLQTEFLPLALFFGTRFVRRARLRDFLGMAATFLAQVYFGWYYTFYLMLAFSLLLLYGLLHHRAALARAPWLACAAAACVVVALALPVTLPYLREGRQLPEFHRSLREAELYSASGLDYFRVDPHSRLAQWIPVAAGPQSYWPGLVTAVLAAIALIAWMRKQAPSEWSDAGYFLSLAAVAYVFSLGPYLHIAHHRLATLPYSWIFHTVPLLSSMRAPGRLAIVVLLGLVVWAALGYELVRRRLTPSTARLLPVVVFAVATITAWQLPLRMLELPTARTLPPVYAWLRAEPDSLPILELPPTAELTDESELEVLRQYYLLYHGNPRLDGASGFVSQRYRRFRASMRTFPAEEAIVAATNMGARLVIVHFAAYVPALRDSVLQRIQADARFEPVAAFGMDRVYRLGGG